MRKNKKNKLFLWIILFFVLLSLAGVSSVIFNKSTSPPDTPPSESVEQEEITTSFTFDLIERDGFYYPTLSAQFQLDFNPDEFILEGFNSSYILNKDRIELTSDGWPLFIFEENVYVFENISIGEHEVSICAYKGKEKIKVISTTISVDYTLVGCGDRMDKASNWLPPV